jgi:hypothetical protein
VGLLAESTSVRSSHLDRQKRKKVSKQKAAQNRALPLAYRLIICKPIY